MLSNQYRAVMQYSIPRDAPGGGSEAPRPSHDWMCGKCGIQNFRRREHCFKCGNRRPEDEPIEGGDEVSATPTPVVLLRGLDVLSTEDSVLTYLMQVSNLPIKSIRIGRDSLTNVSRGVCYVEMNTVADATFLHNKLLGEPPTIDDRLISVSYHRPASSASSSAMAGQPIAANALAAAQWNNQGEAQGRSDDDIERMAEYSASLYAKTPEEKSYYLQYYRNYYRNGGSTQNAGSMVPTKSPTPVSGTVTVNGVEYKRYPTPDVSSYVYEETSGYYYDSSTGLYYDANSTYYYDSKKNSFCYWSQDHHTYLPANNDENKSEDSDKKKEDKKEKIKTAKKIAKDMEKWAKTLNQRKEAAKASQPAPAAATASSSKSSLEDLAFTMLQKQAVSKPAPVASKVELPPTQSGLSGLSNYGSDSDNDDQFGDRNFASSQTDESSLTDWTKLACLLCLRQFPSKDKLAKHNQVSDLHKQNLENWRKKNLQNLSSASVSFSQQYRDRAKERREKYGEVVEPKQNSLKEKYLRAMEEIESGPKLEKNLGSDNLGSKMLQRMGWKEGQGLGKANQGRTDIVEAEHRGSQAGLGSRPATKANPNEHYRDAAKRTLFQRYHDSN